MAQRKRRFSITALLATLAVTLLCVRLGVWQLHRAEEKRQWLAQQAERAALPAATVSELLAARPDQRQHRPAQARGQADNAHAILLDNRINNGRPGYHLLTPLLTDDGHWVLINRGWLPWGASRDTLPAITPLNGPVQLKGTVYVPSSDELVLKNVPLPDNQWPLRVQKVDFAAIGEKLGVELAPFEIRVAPKLALTGVKPLPRHWQDATVMTPQRHQAYALQWFALAAVAVIFFVAATWRSSKRDGEQDT
ncbi:SURF1 family protein [Alcanivorax hongdengensis]|nr:SURF1 family protein [Alcanivorax hongdengensis]